MDRMRSPEKLLALTVLVVLVAGAFLPGAMASAPSLPDPVRAPAAQDGVRLLSTTEVGLTFKVTVPWEQLSLETVTIDGSDYVRVSLPGWQASATPGTPALPALSQAIGVPFGAALSVDVMPGPAHTFPLAAPPLPAATQSAEWIPPAAGPAPSDLPRPRLTVQADPAIYAAVAPYPGTLAQKTSDGVMRQQRVAGISAYPVQYDPAKREITVCESLTITVSFSGQRSAVGGQPVAESAAFEAQLRQALLNYETARAWRQQAPSAIPQVDAMETETSSPEIEGLEGESLPWAPPDPGWRLMIRDEGFYQLTYAELADVGLPVDALDPRTFQLFHLGDEAAIYVEGEDDGSFDASDFILFYGQPVASKYTADNVYWLTYGTAPGARMASRDATPGTAEIPAHYPAQRHLEGNAYYFSNTPGDDALERFMWDYLYPPSRPSWSHTFSLAAPHSDGMAALTVAMVGYLDLSVDPDHHAEVYLNGTFVGDAWWDGIAWQVSTFDLPQNVLLAGDNTLQVVAPNDTGADYDIFYVDWVELHFASGFQAKADELSFSYDQAGTWRFQVDGFTTGQLSVYDVTTPAAPVRIEGLAVTGSGPYSVQFEDSLGAPADYWALADTAYRTVPAIEADTPSSLGSTANGADYIVITHPAFAQQAAALRDLRASQGLRAALVDVQDVYDEFGYGLVGAVPIHAFLAHAYANWQSPAPSYVLLVGDGHYDPKDYLGYGRTSYLPPYLSPVDPWITETAADNRYVTLAGEDTMPDMMLGRLAVNSVAEADVVVNKILAYESLEPAAWQGQVLAVADNVDYAGDFAALSEALLSGYLPESYTAERVYYGVTHPTVSEARAAIQAGINAGALIVNYIGHAGIGLWASEGLLKTADVPNLQNGEKLPVVLPMTCYDGYYHRPHALAAYDAMAEVLTRAANKGAVASWSPTGLGVASGHDYLNRGFFQAVFGDGQLALGPATTAGKLDLWASGANLDLLDTYLLFGDPAMEIAVPEAPPPTPTPTETPPTPTPTETPLPPTPTATPTVEPGLTMHVGDLDGFKSAENKKLWWASVTALILDEDGDPVENATVSGAWSDGVSGTASCLTGIAGLCTVTSDKIPSSASSVTFTVSGVDHASLTYDPAGNADPDGDSDGTTIVVDRDGPTPPTPTPSDTPPPTSTPTETPQPTATPTGAPDVIYVFDIAMSGARTGANRFATAVVTILDGTGNPVQGAAVYGTWSGDYSGPAEGFTTGDGTVTFTSGEIKLKNATFTFTVSDVVKDGLTYDPDLNIETEDTIVVP